jgi:hypothetical protein
MTDWARSTIAKRVCGLRRSRRPNNKRKRISVHTGSPSNCDEPCRGWEVGMACAVVGCWHSRKIRWCGAKGYLLKSFNRCARADL